MKINETRRHGALRKMLWISALLSAAALVAACGGGGGGGGGNASVGSGGTGTFSGAITGFGSVIVNGIRFEDSAATVTIDDDGGTASALRLGMVVDIEGRRNDDGISGTAAAINAGSQVKGPISAKTGTNTGTLTVLGMTVTVNANTAFEAGVAFANLVAGTQVEIHGIPNGADGITATLIETTGNDEERLTGVIQALNTTAKTFTLHGTLINYVATPADKLPTNIANGLTVRVKGQLTTPFAQVPGTIDATRVQVRNNLNKNGQLLELEGIVTTFTSASSFVVNGITVSVASNATREGTVAANLRVEVEGTVDANGVLVATKVEVKNVDIEAEFEVHGTIENFNAGARTFTLRAGTHTVAVRLVGTPTFVAPLTEALLANTVKVEVKGNLVNGVVEVTRIKIDN